MDTLAKSAESAIVNAYNAGDKKGTFAVKVGLLLITIAFADV